MSDGIQVKIDAEAIERQVTQAVLDSSIGKAIAECVESEIKQIANPWKSDGLLKGMVRAEIKGIIRDLLRSDFSETLEEYVRATLTRETIEKIVTKTFLDEHDLESLT